MSDIKPPIFILTKEDPISGYATVGAARSSLEPWFLDEYSPIFFDSLGRRLEVLGDGPYSFQLSKSCSPEPKRLCTELAKAIAQYAQEQADRSRLDNLLRIFSFLMRP